MRICSIAVLFFLSCSSKKETEVLDCSQTHLIKHLISPQYNASINLPAEWTTIDSSTFGVDKHLIGSKMIYSKDSSGSAFALVQDFGAATKLEKDTNEIRKYLKDEIRQLTNNKDSLLEAQAKTNNGWTTVYQASYIKTDKPVYLGQIFSANNGKHLTILIDIPSRQFENAGQVLHCVIDSYTVGKNN